jgi:RNase P subunit RPR2
MSDIHAYTISPPIAENIKMTACLNPGNRELEFYIWRDGNNKQHILELSESDFSNIVESGRRFIDTFERRGIIMRQNKQKNLIQKQSRLKNVEGDQIINPKQPVKIPYKFLKCEKCDKLFLTSKQLKAHLFVHEDHYQLLCEICGNRVFRSYFNNHCVLLHHKK